MVDYQSLYQESENYQKWFTKEIHPIHTLKGHTNSVETVAFNPKHSELVSGSHDNTIRRWDMGSGKCLDIYKEHTEGVWSLQYSNDGNTLLSGSPDKTIMLFDLAQKRPINILKGHTNKVYWAKFNENNTLIASGGEDGQIIVWDMRKGSLLKTIEVDSLVVYSIQFSGDGKYLVSSDYNGVLKVFDTNKWELITQTAKMPTENRAFSCNLDFSQDSKLNSLIYVGFMDCMVRQFRFDQDKGLLEKVKEIQPHLDAVKNISLNGKLDLCVSSSRDGSCRVLEGKSLDFQASLLGHTDNTACSDIIKNSKGTFVCSGSWDQTVNIYKI